MRRSMKSTALTFIMMSILTGAANLTAMDAPQWQSIEVEFQIDHTVDNPYTDFSGHVEFSHNSGETIVRPLFWKGGNRFAVRFASTHSSGQWQWKLTVNTPCTVNSSTIGILDCVPSTKSTIFQKHGYWTIPKGSRQIIHRDGRSAVLVGDTAWALPWRATPEQARIYAKDRARKGFNAALLMTIQPDMKAEGPRDRTKDLGFDVAFEDLPKGHINQLNPAYFEKLDELMAILVGHGIVPVFQPVFHGYGWKGLETAGNIISGEEYARFCKYLVARYGADPAIWLVGGDGIGDAPGLDPGGRVIEEWDAYEHPTGIHYAPHGRTDSYQAAEWLDFQWSQTGHNGEHIPESATRLYYQQPTKASANGEPTYENMGNPGKASGWWQGHEAWSNLCAGGTMGVVYGAGSLWNWILYPGEPGHKSWTVAEGAGWKEALAFEGSTYVGNVGKILSQFNTTGAEPTNRIAPSRRSLWNPGKLLVVYISNGTKPWFPGYDDLPELYRIYNPKSAELVNEGTMSRDTWNRVSLDGTSPYIIVLYDEDMLYQGS